MIFTFSYHKICHNIGGKLLLRIFRIKLGLINTKVGKLTAMATGVSRTF